MAEKKVKLAFITHDASRRLTYRRRKQSLMKKVNELSTLCGIDATVIMYNLDKPESEPDVWPNIDGANRVLAQFMSMTEKERKKNMMNHFEYSSEMLMRETQKLEKLVKKNKKKEMTIAMHQFINGGTVQNLSLTDLNLLKGTIDETLTEIYQKIESLKK